MSVRPSKAELDRDLDRRIEARIAELNAPRCAVCNAPTREGLIYCGGSLKCWKEGEGLMGGYDKFDDEDLNEPAAPVFERGRCGLGIPSCPHVGDHVHTRDGGVAKFVCGLGFAGCTNEDPAHAHVKFTPTPDDPVNPSHYKLGGIEVIDAIEAWRLNFNRGQVVKYVARAGHKDPAALITDLEKAAYYLQREIATLKKERAK